MAERGSLESRDLRSRDWLLSYKTSSTIIDGRPVNILQDFYVPALRLAVRYDRVAGYFRSSSLAAASQGFSAFVGRQGKMRLVVGADLEPDDVKAILSGDAQRFASRLSEQLDGMESWPENERNGVVLLAWMVARGRLEVRVAFRVHGETGEPLPIGAVDDGYVHEKWFVLRDEFNNRLYGAGTLNESKTALVLNAENIDVHCDWWGPIDRQRVDDAEQAFEDLWSGRVRHMPVLTLPEAVQRRLLRISREVTDLIEVDGTHVTVGVTQPPSAMELLRFAIVRDAPKMPGGRFVGMETAPVAPWPHQAIVARRLIETWPYSYLLCDEVGLGKTIEAGLAMRSLYLSGLAKRILIAAPPSVTPQWHREMASKVLLSFGLARTAPEVSHDFIFPHEKNLISGSIFGPDLAIVSTGLLSRRDRAQTILTERQYDIVLIDEAHALRRRNPSEGSGGHPDFGYLYVSVRDYVRKMARALWFATATPMQIDAIEVCDLLALTNRVGAFQFDPALTLQYYEVLEKVVQDQDPEEDEWEFLRRSLLAAQMQDPMLWRFIEESVMDARIRATTRQWLEYGQIPRGRDRYLIRRLLFSGSPLSRVMLRHTRRLLEVYREKGQLGQRLARRHILPVPRIVFTPLERQVYDQLEDYCKGLDKQVRLHGDSQNRQMMNFLLSFFRLRFASSLFAIRETLGRRRQKVNATLKHELNADSESDEPRVSVLQDAAYDGEGDDDLAVVESLLQNRTIPDLEWERDRLTRLLDSMVDLTGPSSKMQVLLQALDKRRVGRTGRFQQTVIFTRFYDTLRDLVDRLRQVEPRMQLGTYSGRGGEYSDPSTGRILSCAREEVKGRFLRGEIDVLVCTDAAAEGLNLQTADLLVNFDLGWNPMKVEQRIGRIDRIGQRHENIYVLNFCYADSAEETVYGRLLSRLADANIIIGTQQISLLPVQPDEFRQLAEGNLSPEELESKARERITRQRRRVESMEIESGELYEIYSRRSRDKATRIPVDLSFIWKTLAGSEYLHRLGCVASVDPATPVLALSGMDSIPDGAALTVSRELLDVGLAGDCAQIHFASYGDPFFDALLDHLDRFDLPANIKRISVAIPEMEGVELVAYGVSCCGPDGDDQTRLILKSDDLKGLELTARALRDEDVECLRDSLQEIARKEFQPYLAAGRIERENQRAARVQEMLGLLVVQSLLGARASFAGGGALFAPVIREVVSLFEERSRIAVHDLPADVLRPVADLLLFDVSVPSVGEKASISISRTLAEAAIQSASRIANGMKVRRSELSADMVLARLRREIQVRRRDLSAGAGP